MRVLAFLVLFGMTQSTQAHSVQTSPMCEVTEGTFVLDLGRAKAPTYAGVILPDGRMLRLKYAPEQIDTLGPGYANGRLRIPLGSLMGVDHGARRERVFTTPGTYQFVLQDANTAEGIELHRLQCSVALTNSQLTSSGT
jgi:hypothetical protein